MGMDWIGDVMHIVGEGMEEDKWVDNVIDVTWNNLNIIGNY